MGNPNDPLERRARWLAELEDLYVRKVDLDATHKSLDKELRKTAGALNDVERRMRKLTSKAFGLRDKVKSASVARTDLVQVLVQVDEPANPVEGSVPASDVSSTTRSQDRTDAGDDIRLRTPRQRKTWGHIQTVRDAIRRLGGAGTRGDIVQQVQLVEPSFAQRNIRNILEKFEHFTFGADRRWRYVDGPPPLCGRDLQIKKRYDLITAAIEDLGGVASWTEIVDQVQRHSLSPDEAPGDLISRYLRTGPYEQLRDGRWRNAPQRGYLPMYQSHQRYKAEIPTVFAEPFEPALFDVERWHDDTLKSRAMQAWERVKVVGQALMNLGGSARSGALITETQKLDPFIKANTVHGLLRKDPHFGKCVDGKWTWIPGPPRRTAAQLQLATRRKAIAEAIQEHGGAANIQEIFEKVCKASGADQVSITNLGATLSSSEGFAYEARDKTWRIAN